MNQNSIPDLSESAKIADAELAASKPTEQQSQQFETIRCLLANLYVYVMQERPHLKTQEGFIVASTLPWIAEELNVIQFALLSLMLRLAGNADLYLSNAVKIPDQYILQLIRHTMFEGKPPEEYKKMVHVTGKQKEYLKELAMRIS